MGLPYGARGGRVLAMAYLAAVIGACVTVVIVMVGGAAADRAEAQDRADREAASDLARVEGLRDEGRLAGMTGQTGW